MTSGGKNSADFGICFFAGVLMQQLPKETHFVIISNDTDLDHVVNLLKGQGPGLFHSKFRYFVHLRERAVPGIRDFRLRWLKPPKLVT